MKVAVAILFVLTACAIFVLQAEHCVATAGNETGNQTGNHSLNQTNTTINNSTNHTNQTQQNNLTQGNNNSTNSTDDDDYSYDYNDEYNNYYDNGTDENYDNNEVPEYGPSGRGAITGVILSSAGSHAVPNANVALYDGYGNLVNIPDNPQLSSNGTGNNGGVYTFYDVPYGQYTVSAEKGGIEFFAIVNLTTGTATANVVLPEYVESEPAYQAPQPPEMPTPTPRPLRYFIPITVGKMPAASAPQDNLPYGLAAIGGACALFLFTRRNGNGKA